MEHQSTPDHFMAFRLFKYYRQTFNPAPEIVNIYLLSIH
ncbi:MAG: hypothetical protein O7D30_00600 [Rickettsia endosymbiont of Ixodes persulcatus]|nr:hypothetical protein [Rickettsia endosymbiont of Ixodes persulcatus]